jgi:hypothetical protein
MTFVTGSRESSNRFGEYAAPVDQHGQRQPGAARATGSAGAFDTTASSIPKAQKLPVYRTA